MRLSIQTVEQYWQCKLSHMCFNNWQYIQAGFSNSSGLKVAHFQIIGSLNLMQSKSKNSEIEKNMFHYLCTGFKQN